MQKRQKRSFSGKPTGGGMTTSIPGKEILEQILAGDVKTLVTWADTIGRGLAKNERLTTSQVRSFFGAVRRIQADVEASNDKLSPKTYRQLVLLKPKLAYQAQRERDTRKSYGVARLEQVLTPAIDLVEDNVERFNYFTEFFEAILAYHKAAGGRDD